MHSLPNFWKSVLHTSGAKIYSMALAVIALAITARALGPSGRGEIAVVLTWVSIFSSIFGLSLGQVSTHRMLSINNRSNFTDLLFTLIFLALSLTVLGWIFAYFAYAKTSIFSNINSLVLIVGFISLPFMLWEQFGSSLLISLEKLNIYNKYQVIGRTLGILLIFLSIFILGQRELGVMTSMLIGQAVVSLGGVYFLLSQGLSKVKFPLPVRSELKALLIGGAKLHFNAIGTMLFTSANIVILNFYHGKEQAAFLQLALQLLAVPMIIPQAATMVMFGKVVKLGPNNAWPINKEIFIQIVILMACISLLAAFLAPWAIMILAGKDFAPAIIPFRLMLIALVGMTFSTLMSPQWIGRGYFWQAASLTVFAGLINLLANFILVPKYGIYGAVYSFIATYLFSLIVNGLMAVHCESAHQRSSR